MAYMAQGRNIPPSHDGFFSKPKTGCTLTGLEEAIEFMEPCLYYINIKLSATKIAVAGPMELATLLFPKSGAHRR